MTTADAELARLLEERDGPLGTYWRPHRAPGEDCRYVEHYPDGACPWCVAASARGDQDKVFRS
jgi:hypothetical protein